MLGVVLATGLDRALRGMETLEHVQRLRIYVWWERNMAQRSPPPTLFRKSVLPSEGNSTVLQTTAGVTSKVWTYAHSVQNCEYSYQPPVKQTVV